MILGGTILAMALAMTAFVGGHFLLSHPLRAALTRAVGAKGFPGAYSLVVLLCFVWMIHAHASAPYVALWGDPIWARHLLLAIMIPSVLLVVAGNTTPSRTALGLDHAPGAARAGAGIHAICRHPSLAGMALWAAGHMIANGDAATVILTGGILVLTIGGMMAIDARKLRDFGAEYAAFMAHTSLMPFLALAQGRAKFSWPALGWWRVALAVAVYAALLFGHQYFIGRSALPV